MVALFELFSVCSSRVDKINSDSVATQISTALVKRVRRYDRLTVDIGYITHVEYSELVGGSGDVYIDVTFSW